MPPHPGAWSDDDDEASSAGDEDDAFCRRECGILDLWESSEDSYFIPTGRGVGERIDMWGSDSPTPPSTTRTWDGGPSSTASSAPSTPPSESSDPPDETTGTIVHRHLFSRPTDNGALVIPGRLRTPVLAAIMVVESRGGFLARPLKKGWVGGAPPCLASGACRSN